MQTKGGTKGLIPLTLRMRPNLHALLKASAPKNLNSLNAEIERRLERTFIEDRERAAQISVGGVPVEFDKPATIHTVWLNPLAIHPDGF